MAESALNLSPLLRDPAGRPITTPAAWRRERSRLRRAWVEFLGGFPRRRAALRLEILATERREDFTRHRIRYQAEAGVAVEAYLLGPRGRARRRPGIVVFHQTTRTNFAQPAGVDAAVPELMHGVQLAGRGYVVLCPRCFIFEDGAVEAVGFARNVAAMQRRHPAWPGLTRMTWDAMRAADVLTAWPGVDPGRIGAIGHSLGAKEALYAAAFDERYRAVVYNDGGLGPHWSNWQAPWYLGPRINAPGFALNHQQLLALAAPRAFLFLAGESEDGERSRPYVEAAREVYRLLGAEASLGWLNHRAGHCYPPEARTAAEAFFERCLSQVGGISRGGAEA